MRGVFVLVGAVVFLVLSFVVPVFHLQFLVLGAIMLCYYFSQRTSVELEEMKEIINRHNELVKEDIELLKRDEEDIWN